MGPVNFMDFPSNTTSLSDTLYTSNINTLITPIKAPMKKIRIISLTPSLNDKKDTINAINFTSPAPIPLNR